METSPTLAEVIRGAIESRLLDVHTSIPGKVVTYDPTTQTADVQPTVRRALSLEDGVEHEDLPIIPNVPVGWMRGGGFGFQFPLVPGDHVWLVFSEAATGAWRESGDLSDPVDHARHDLSYPIALPVCAPDSGALPAALGALVSLLSVPAGGTLYLGGQGPTADYVALAGKVEAALAALKAAISGAPVTAGDGGAAFKAAIVAALSSWPAPTGAVKVKGE